MSCTDTSPGTPSRVIVGLVVLLLAGTAKADTVGYELVIYGMEGDVDDPVLRLTNTSAAVANITSVSFTIGNMAYDFDRYYHNLVTSDALGGSTGVDGDFVAGSNPGTTNDGFGVDQVRLDFSNFHPNDFFRVPLEIDEHAVNASGAVGSDFRTVFFNNGASPNSVITVAFSTGATLSMTLPDQMHAANDVTFSFSQSAPVPLPAAAWAGLTLFGVVGARRVLRPRGCV